MLDSVYPLLFGISLLSKANMFMAEARKKESNGGPFQVTVQTFVSPVPTSDEQVSFCSYYRYDTFIERSCEQLNIARRQQMNVEITAKIKRLICCDGHYPSTTRRTTFNYIDWTYHFS